jgi:hypothetical protein
MAYQDKKGLQDKRKFERQNLSHAYKGFLLAKGFPSSNSDWCHLIGLPLPAKVLLLYKSIPTHNLPTTGVNIDHNTSNYAEHHSP